MDFTQERKDKILILRLKGKLDSSNSTEFEESLLHLIESGEKQISVDFSKLDFVSSAGLRVFLLAAKKIKKEKGKISLFAMNGNIKEVFDITGFSAIIPIFQTEEEAMEIFI